MTLHRPALPASWTVRTCLLAALIVVVIQARGFGFEIYNDTTYAMRASVLEGDFVEVIPPNEMRSCNWQNTDCNPTGQQAGVLTLRVETLDENGRDFMATAMLVAGARAYIRQESRDGMNLAPLFYVESWNVAGTQLVDDTGLGIGDQERYVRFLVSADCQYQNHDTDREAVSNTTMQRMQSIVSEPTNRVRGILLAGDLTQWARVDEWDQYCDSIRGYEEFYYDGLGNHDLLDVQNLWEIDSCFFSGDSAPWCAIPEVLADTVRNRKHRTTKTNKAPGTAPHYSWDWNDVHFVQLNLFPGDDPTNDPAATDGAELDPANALSFLIDDLAEHVHNSGRPVVLIHHYGVDTFSINGHWWSDSERLAYWNAIAPYNVAGIFTGHWHAEEADTTTWRVDWQRPAEGADNHDEISTFVAGATLNGIFLDVEINADDRMTVTRRANDGRILNTQYVYFGLDDVYDLTVGNDSCSEAVDLFPFGEDLSDLRIIGDDEDWYRIPVPSHSELRVNSTFLNAAGNLDLLIYKACNEGPVKWATDSVDNESVRWTNPGPDTDAYIRVRQHGTSVHTVAYDLSVTVGEDNFEENDTCATATAISEGDYQYLSLSNDDEDWYRVILPAATAMSVHMQEQPQSPDLRFQIWEDCDSGPVIFSQESGTSEDETYPNDGPERTMYIRAYAQGQGGKEQYDLSIDFAPLGPTSCNSIPLTQPGDYSDLDVYDGLDDWYKIETQPSALTTVTLDFDDAQGNIDLEFWFLCDFGRFQTSTSHNDSESLSYEGDGFGEVIYVRVRMADPGGFNYYDLSISNHSLITGADDCADATPISGMRTFQFDNTNATTDGAPHPLCNYFGNDTITRDVWFDWTSTLTGTATLSICPSGTSVDTKVAVYEGTSCTGVIVACDDDTCEHKSEVAFDVAAGDQFKIRIGNFGPAAPGSGMFDIGIEDQYGPLDDCNNAKLLAPGEYSNLALPGRNSGPGVRSDWWATMVPANTRLTVDLLFDDGVTIDRQDDFELFKSLGSGCPGPSAGGAIPTYISGGIRDSDDNPGAPRLYYIRVTNNENDDGMNYGLRIIHTLIDDPLEPNDTCNSPAMLSTGLTDNLRCQDDDYYAIDLPETTILDVSALFAQAEGDLSLSLYRTCGIPILVSNTQTDDEEVQYVNSGPAETIIVRVARINPTSIVPYAMFVRITDIDDCNGNAIPDAIEVADQPAIDCNGNGVPDECDIDNMELAQNNTGVDDSIWLGMPDDEFAGIGSDRVLYSLSETARVVDGPGSDFNVYEVDIGGPEFDQMRVYVGLNQFNLVDITDSAAPVVRIPGDELHGDNAFARSYDISGSGYSRIKYIAIEGVDGLGPAGETNGFDLDAIGLIYVIPTSCDDDFDGDMNCDGVVDMLDVSLFASALVDPDHYLAHEPICPMQRGDVNRDGMIDGHDAQGFVDRLTMQ